MAAPRHVGEEPNVGIAGAHRIVDDDAAIELQIAALRQIDIGPIAMMTIPGVGLIVSLAAARIAAI